jgi:hypothetical protein
MTLTRSCGRDWSLCLRSITWTSCLCSFPAFVRSMVQLLQPSRSPQTVSVDDGPDRPRSAGLVLGGTLSIELLGAEVYPCHEHMMQCAC